MLEFLESRLLLSRTFNGLLRPADSITVSRERLPSPSRRSSTRSALAEPGDTVFIRGGTYHETVTPAHSGTASAPNTYSAYNNETVTIDSA